MMTRLAMIGVVVAIVLAIAGGIFNAGGDRVRARVAIDQAEETAKAAIKNTAVAEAVSEATDALAQHNAALHREVADARREIERLAATPAPEGYVGARAVVDPAVGVGVLCRIGRMRGQLPSYCGDRPADRPAVEPRLEPVSARTAT